MSNSPSKSCLWLIFARICLFRRFSVHISIESDLHLTHFWASAFKSYPIWIIINQPFTISHIYTPSLSPFQCRHSAPPHPTPINPPIYPSSPPSPPPGAASRAAPPKSQSQYAYTGEKSLPVMTCLIPRYFLPTHVRTVFVLYSTLHCCTGISHTHPQATRLVEMRRARPASKEEKNEWAARNIFLPWGKKKRSPLYHPNSLIPTQWIRLRYRYNNRPKF